MRGTGYLLLRGALREGADDAFERLPNAINFRALCGHVTDTLGLRGGETLVLHPVANNLAPHREGADDGFERLPNCRG